VQGTGEASINQAGATGDQLVGHVKASANLLVLQAGWKHLAPGSVDLRVSRNDLTAALG
jgi:hypothetical protein